MTTPVSSRFLWATWFATWLVLAVSFVDPPCLVDQSLHHIPTVVLLPILPFVARRLALSPFSIGCLLAFIWVHIVASRWAYSLVPYDQWSRDWFGFAIGERWDFRRNHFDRLVHFAYGVFIVPPQIEVLARSRRPGSARFWSLVLVVAVSSVYELVEWGVAFALAPERAERYNGQQGDMWDPHKDTTAAILGAVVSTALGLAARRFRPAQRS